MVIKNFNELSKHYQIGCYFEHRYLRNSIFDEFFNVSFDENFKMAKCLPI